MERTYIKNEEGQKFLNDLETLTKDEITEVLSYFFDITDMEATADENTDENKFMINEFGKIKRGLLNRLKIMIKHKVKEKQ